MSDKAIFSLCIPTYHRYDNFLKNYLPLYLTNPYISEIIICDEIGDDYDKIIRDFPQNPKLKVYKNETRLGALLNKLKVSSLASNQWIAIIDSDNFADIDYFEIATKFLKENPNISNNSILSPSWAKPDFDYRHLSKSIYNKHTIRSIETNERKIGKNSSSTLMNTGNYIINKYLIDNLKTDEFINNGMDYNACDVIYLNTILFEQLDLHLYVLENMFYSHVVHDGSIYTNECNRTRNTCNIVHNRYYSLR